MLDFGDTFVVLVRSVWVDYYSRLLSMVSTLWLKLMNIQWIIAQFHTQEVTHCSISYTASYPLFNFMHRKLSIALFDALLSTFLVNRLYL